MASRMQLAQLTRAAAATAFAASALVPAGARGALTGALLGRGGRRGFGFGSHVSDNDPEVLEREKQRSLKGEPPVTNPDFRGWNERLASDSEAVVKGEQSREASPQQLQEETVRLFEADEVRADGGGAEQPLVEDTPGVRQVAARVEAVSEVIEQVIDKH